MAEKTFQIWDSDEIRAIKAAAPIATEGEFTEGDMVEIDRLLTACYMVMKPPGEQEHPSQVRVQLTGLRNGFGCWLDFVGRAILKAKVSDEDRLMVYGAYSMACAFLFDIEGHRRPRRDWPARSMGTGERHPMPDETTAGNARKRQLQFTLTLSSNVQEEHLHEMADHWGMSLQETMEEVTFSGLDMAIRYKHQQERTPEGARMDQRFPPLDDDMPL